MIGKTIAGVEENADSYGDLLLRFTDGTAVRLEATGYEADSVAIHELDAAALAEFEEEQNERREREAKDAAKREKERAEIAQASATMTPAEFEVWMRERLGPMGYLMRETYLGVIKDQMRMTNSLFYGGGHFKVEGP